MKCTTRQKQQNMLLSIIGSIAILQLHVLQLTSAFPFTLLLLPTQQSHISRTKFNTKRFDSSYYNQIINQSSSSSSTFKLYLSSNNKEEEDEITITKIKEILIQTNPYEILNISPSTSDKKEIKRAYRRLAMKYHPDVISNAIDKRLANDVFIKINTAYEDLLNGNGNYAKSASSNSNNGSSYTPPHRRKASSGASYDTNFDWDEYMNNYQKEDEPQYENTDGDSLGAIFSDLIQEVVVGSSSSGGKGIFNDFVEFLEKSVDGFSTGNYDSDPSLEQLLYEGTIHDIKNELDDTELIIQQLQTKLNDITNQLQQFEQQQQEGNGSFRKTLEIDEQKAELLARKNVMIDYIQKGQQRLIKLQLRYKELRNTSTSSSSAYNDYNGNNNESTYSSTQQQQQQQQPRSSTKESNTSNVNEKTSSSTGKDNDTSSSSSSSWKRQGFGSSGRGRGRSRRGSTSTTSTPSSSSTASSNTDSYYNSNPTTTSQQQQQSSYTARSTTTSSSSLSNNSIPPHRRTSSTKSYAKQVMEDKKRLRQLQIDEEFEKLKNEINKK